MESPTDANFERLRRLMKMPSVKLGEKIFVGEQHHAEALDKAVAYAKAELTGPGSTYEGLSDTEIKNRVADDVQDGYGDGETEAFVPREEIQL